MVMPRSFSWSLESMTRSFSASLRSRVPDRRSSLSTRVVLRWSTWAMMAMLRSFSITVCISIRGFVCRPVWTTNKEKRRQWTERSGGRWRMLPPFNPGDLCRTINAHIGMPLAQQVMGMQATHDAVVAIPQELAVLIQFLEFVVQRVERQYLHFDPRHFQRRVLGCVGMANVDDDLPGQCLTHFLDLHVLAQFVDDAVDGQLRRALQGAIEDGHVELRLLLL